MRTRRAILQQTATVGINTGVALVAAPGLLEAIGARTARAGWQSPDEAARDEAYWSLVAQGFVTDGRHIILNGGGQNPPPSEVLDALVRYDTFAAAQPRPNNIELIGRREHHRRRLARLLGCESEELALTRNTTEGLNIVVNGFEMEPGDEILSTNFEKLYAAVPARLRALRQGIVAREIPIPSPTNDDEIVERIVEAINPRTRLIVASHVADAWGFVLPIARISEEAHARGIAVLADGALSFGHLDFDVRRLGCDFFASSLHKWLSAPLGTGILYVRRDRISSLWPLYGAREPQSADIRKFEEIGTRSGPTIAAIGQAIDFHERIGPANKAARLRYLGQYILDRLRDVPGVECITDADPSRRGSLMRIRVRDHTGRQVEAALRDRYGIWTFGGLENEGGGIYISPNLFNLPNDLDRFVEAMVEIAAQ